MLNKELTTTLVTIAQKRIEACLNFRQPRLDQIEKYLKSYSGRVERQLKGRSNVPLPILSGYIDTLMSKIDDAPAIIYNPTEEADYKAAKKITQVYKIESGMDRGNWAYIDRAVKKLAIFSGFGVYKYYAESDPEYRSCLEPVDFYDFVFEPKGGADIDKHSGKGQINIFRTKAQIREGIKSGLYDRENGSLLLNGIEQGVNKEDMEEIATQKNARYVYMGLDSLFNNFTGDGFLPMCEYYLKYDGEDYYLFFDYKSGLALRAEKLSDVIKSGDCPFITWHTHEDAFNFMSKSGCDDIYPVAESMQSVFNSAMTNLERRSEGMRAFNSNVFKKPQQLIWRYDGLIEADLPAGQDIRSALMDIQTEDNTASVERLITFLDAFIGQKTGITPSAQGVSEQDKKVGVLYADLQQVADRLGLLNKSYREAWARIGKRFVAGLKEHLTQPYAIKVIGIAGAEWDELKKDEIGEFSISIEGGNSEQQANELKSQKQMAALVQFINLNGGQANDWVKEEVLRKGGYDEQDVKRALDANMAGSDEILSEAAQSIEIIISAPTVPLQVLMDMDFMGRAKLRVNSGATIGFVRKILDFAEDNYLKPQVKDNLIEYANLHIQVAARNMKRKLMQVGMETGQPQVASTGQPAKLMMPMGTKQGNAGMSQNISNAYSGGMAQ